MAHSKSENALKLVSLSDCHGSQRFEERETHNDSRFFFSESIRSCENRIRFVDIQNIGPVVVRWLVLFIVVVVVSCLSSS